MQPDITQEQRANLRKLADYLLSGKLAMRFDMRAFCRDTVTSVHPSDWECGTVGCAAGHGPAAGIAPLPNEGWYNYACRAFGKGVYDWCFGPNWQDVDNTPEGAAYRIRWMLDHGIPDDRKAQMRGKAPLCYRPKDMMAIFAPEHVEAE